MVLARADQKYLQSPEHQLALQLFQELEPQNVSIAQSKVDVGFNINQVLVDVKDLSVLARRALLGCYFLAATTPENLSGQYDFDLGFFKWLINYSNSNNLTHLKKVLREAQKAALEANLLDPEHPTKDKWASVPLMGIVTIQGGRIAFQLPSPLVAGIANPDGIMMYLSLRIQANFTSIYAQTLFAKVVPLKSDGCTPWMSLPEFARWMNIDQFKWAKEYRYLNRDVICVAVAQINEHSDIELTLDTKKEAGTRKVAFLRFLIRAKQDQQNWTGAANSVVSEQQIYDVLTNEFRMSPKDLDTVMANRDRWTNSRILDAIAYTRHRMNDSKQEHLRKPGSYFLKALAEGYRIVTEEEHKAAQADKAFELNRRQQVQQEAKSKAAIKVESTETKAILAAYAKLDEGKQAELWALYLKSPAWRAVKLGLEAEAAGSPDRVALLRDPKIKAGFARMVKPYLLGQQ